MGIRIATASERTGFAMTVWGGLALKSKTLLLREGYHAGPLPAGRGPESQKVIQPWYS